MSQWSMELGTSFSSDHASLQEIMTRDLSQWSMEPLVHSNSDDELRDSCLVNFDLQCNDSVSLSSNDDPPVADDMFSSGSHVSNNRPSRKRKRNVHKWARNIRKAKRTNGKSYISTSGTTKPAKQLGSDCQCKRKCCETFSLEVREKIFEEFYTLDEESQAHYIANLIEEFPKKSTTVSYKSRREFTRKYFFSNRSEVRFEVCQKMFLNTFAISLKKIRVIVEKKRASDVGILANSQRGKHGKQKKISQARKTIIKRHINMFPCYKSHYSRSHTKKKYLGSDLNIAKMHRLYLEYCNEKDILPVKESFYRKVFVEDFNLAFKKPKNDTCGKCDKFKLQLEVETDLEVRRDIETEQNAHIQLYESSYSEKQKDTQKAKENSKVVTLSFDLEKCLPTPFIKSNFAFYKRKLWTFNLTAYKVSQELSEAFCFLWDETIAARGGQEIASCVYKLLSSFAEDLDEINLFSDNCTGQNKNVYVAVMFLHFISEKSNGPKIINHKFLEAGHTHMEADAIHAAIEKEKNKTTMKIELPKDWANLIRTVRRNPPINVTEMQQTEFYNFQKLLTEKYIHRKANTQKEPINWNAIKWMQYRKDQPGIVFYKKTFDANIEFSQLNLIRGRSRNIRVFDCGLVPLHDIPITLPIEKVNDLQSFLNYLQPSSRPFYTSLRAGLERDDCTSVSEDELDD